MCGRDSCTVFALSYERVPISTRGRDSGHVCLSMNFPFSTFLQSSGSQLNVSISSFLGQLGNSGLRKVFCFCKEFLLLIKISHSEICFIVVCIDDGRKIMFLRNLVRQN
ncbi:hypothetical protein POVWA2_036580 [Plasmodium ovale wallikeri]|uniref:Uncharacterized protein n=1 Tax=Plasmodium ovale wallikeri TaxID=864142 RepID=A0A1A8Z4T3_PLAOA|nr:hypothetical protein POVWA1_037350 [Plasmodium ovale wallikeri]SBT38861.1 hypothetical protein POVWA2_036580 [Plasmodium ovale wallikeri]